MELEKKNIHAFIDRLVQEVGSDNDAVIPLLHAIQKEFHYLPEPALQRVCEITDITPAAITGVSTFYPQFHHKPVGRHIIRICTGTACHVKGADLVYTAFRRELHISDDRDTDPDRQFTVCKVACLGCCTIAPVVQMGDVTYGHLQVGGVPNIVNDFLLNQGKEAPSSNGQPSEQDLEGEIRVGLGSCCVASGSSLVRQALEKSLRDTGIQTRVKRVGCVGMCHKTPLLEVNIQGQEPVLYARVKPEEVHGIVLRHFRPDTLRQRIKNAAFQFIEKILDNQDRNGVTRHPLHMRDAGIKAFLGRQRRITTEHSGQIDPLDLREYRQKGGFLAVHRCLAALSGEEIIDQINASGLRGRGGAGFPTGQKWDVVRRSKDNIKYVICNGDEGDPGAFMDRMILESYPFRVIEGMIISAYAVGAHEGYFYIRAEYQLAVRRIREALEMCRAEGLLGDNILNKGFSLDLNVVEGAGAFVCGEETALIASIEGQRGNPSFRPPYPAEKGLRGHATLVNNCETLATVPWIIRNGAATYAKLGTAKSKGTKVFSLAGKVARGGLIEVPMGITIREIVEDIGGGIENNKTFKAVQIGGPSGGCIPASLADTSVDYEELTGVGAMMGSGGLLVMDESDCMVDIARYFMEFICNQSCGNCTFCRLGTRHMLRILTDLCEGRGNKKDLEKLEEIALMTKQGSLCGLGKTAPNPVVTTLQYFREEYEAHLQGRCPAKRCEALITYSIDESCIGCTVCAQKCPVDAIPAVPYQQHAIDQETCTKCGICAQVCPSDSVTIS